MSRKRQKAGNRIRNRSFGGCATCRSRHLKCDEGRPTCSMCRELNISCGGYDKSVFFDLEETPSNEMLRFRRPILSEKERQRMSESLISTIPPSLALWHLSQIDEQCDNASNQSGLQVSHGPFGVFKLESPENCGTVNLPLEASSNPNEHPSVIRVDLSSNDSAESDMQCVPRPQEVQDIVLDESESVIDFAPQFDPVTLNFDITPTRQPLLDDMLSAETEGYPDMSMVPLLPIEVLHSDLQSELPPRNLHATHHQSLLPRIDYSVPQDAVSLIRHYTTTVIGFFTPFCHQKTPWHVLFVPHIKNCLAALTIGEDLDKAQLSAFYGVLAISALSLGGVTHSQALLDQADHYAKRATLYASQMLKTVYDTPKVSKYKSVLIALITMAQMSILSSTHTQTESYLLEAEKFIRLRGLQRKKSRKVRLLHHCYAFERIFYESTPNVAVNPNQREALVEAIERSNLIVRGQDNLNFRLRDWKDLPSEMLFNKNQAEGENDLHLEQPGVWSRTLYPEIFGVPESWIMLLSLVIRLSREKENENPRMNVKTFFDRAKALEHCIIQLTLPQEHLDSLELDKYPQAHRMLLTDMLDAIRHALAIFFYRRIYNVDVSMLQARVLLVRDCLLRSQSTDRLTQSCTSRHAHGNTCFAWPALIAACEAKDLEVQEDFLRWFRTSAARTGLKLFTDILERVEQLWSDRVASRDFLLDVDV